MSQVEQTVFSQDGDNQPEQNSQAAPAVDNQSAASELVGEGKKFTDVDALAKGKLEADNHIGNLENQIKDLREELGKRQTAEEIAEQLRNEQTQVQTPAPAVPGMSAEEVQGLVQSTITQTEAAKTYAQNAKEADRMFKATHGEKANEVFVNKASELGMSTQELQDIAGKSPTAFAQMMGVSSSESTQRPEPLTSSVNQDALNLHNPTAIKEGSHAYWSAKRKELGQKFWEPKIQQQMLKDKEEGRYDA